MALDTTRMSKGEMAALIEELTDENTRLRLVSGTQVEQIAALERQMVTLEAMLNDADETVAALLVEDLLARTEVIVVEN